MRVFAAVVEAGSFTTASTRLDMSRASTSEHIEHLEKHLDEKRMLVILRPNIQPRVGGACSTLGLSPYAGRHQPAICRNLQLEHDVADYLAAFDGFVCCGDLIQAEAAADGVRQPAVRQ
jgi:hypothetical protein